MYNIMDQFKISFFIFSFLIFQRKNSDLFVSCRGGENTVITIDDPIYIMKLKTNKRKVRERKRAKIAEETNATDGQCRQQEPVKKNVKFLFPFFWPHSLFLSLFFWS